MLPTPISFLDAQFDKFERRCKPTGTVHNRPPMPGVCSICIAPLWGVANDDDDEEGGDYTKRVGEVNMPPDLEAEVRRRLGPNRFNRLVNPSRLRAPPDMWGPRHQEGRSGDLLPVQSLSCDHWFHQECIMQWASSNPHCPQCRLPIRADDLRDMGLGELAAALAPAVPEPVNPLTVPQARAQLEQARVQQSRLDAVRQQANREAADSDRIARAREQAVQRQRKQVDRLRISVAKQQIKKWDQVERDAARRATAERKVGVAERRVANAVGKRDAAMQRGYNAGEEDRLMNNVAVANAQLDSARAARDATPEADRRREDEAGALRGKLFVMLRHKHVGMGLAPANEIEFEKRNIWAALHTLRDMYAGSDAVEQDRRINGLAASIYMHVQEGYDETEARVPNLTSSTIDDVLAKTFQHDLWKEGGRYNMDITQGRHWYVDSSYAEVTRGLWIVDPLVPLPNEEQALQWPPAPQGAVATPPEVSLWYRSGAPAVWRPMGLVARPPAPEELTEEERARLATRDAQSVLLSRIETIMIERMAGTSAVDPHTEMMSPYARDLAFIVAHWDEYPEPASEFWSNFQATRDAFLASVDLLDLWSRLGGTEAEIRRLTRGWIEAGFSP